MNYLPTDNGDREKDEAANFLLMGSAIVWLVSWQLKADVERRLLACFSFETVRRGVWMKELDTLVW